MKSLKLILTLILFTQINFAQGRKITGVVVDQDGGPILGATVIIYKTHEGTKTDFDGKYSIKASLTDTLMFSYIEMKSQKIKADKDEINVQLEYSVLSVEGGIPYMRPKIIPIEFSTITIKELKKSQKK